MFQPIGNTNLGKTLQVAYSPAKKKYKKDTLAKVRDAGLASLQKKK